MSVPARLRQKGGRHPTKRGKPRIARGPNSRITAMVESPSLSRACIEILPNCVRCSLPEMATNVAGFFLPRQRLDHRRYRRERVVLHSSGWLGIVIEMFFSLDARLTGSDWMSIKHDVPSPIDGEFFCSAERREKQQQRERRVRTTTTNLHREPPKSREKRSSHHSLIFFSRITGSPLRIDIKQNVEQRRPRGSYPGDHGQAHRVSPSSASGHKLTTKLIHTLGSAAATTRRPMLEWSPAMPQAWP